MDEKKSYSPKEVAEIIKVYEEIKGLATLDTTEYSGIEEFAEISIIGNTKINLQILQIQLRDMKKLFLKTSET
mgnify:CR=1 FL=1